LGVRRKVQQDVGGSGDVDERWRGEERREEGMQPQRSGRSFIWDGTGMEGIKG
jgi:hypothetical protein